MATIFHLLSRWLLRYRFPSLPCSRTFGAHRLLLRQLEAGDATRLIEFFASHTPETIRARYGYAVAELSPSEALRRVAVDQLRDAALGAFERNETGSHLVAVARYCVSADERSAEMAFVVREDLRCLGICTTLLRALIHIARNRRVGHLTAQVQSRNISMLAVFRKAGAKLRPLPGGDGVEASLAIHPLYCAELRDRLARAAARIHGDFRSAAEREWLRVENACSHLLGNYPLP
jgi:RimJ/RimL family protein N-acetyltransferase